MNELIRVLIRFFQPTMAEGGEYIDLVEDIITTPFSRQTFQEKLDIVRIRIRNRFIAKECSY